MKIKCIRLLPLILLGCTLVSPYTHAQKKGEAITTGSIYFLKPLPDSIWTKMSVREKLDYSFRFAESPMQLCGLWPVDSGRNEQAFIYRNTRQLFFLGEYYYSKRQHDFFDQQQDSIAWLLREDLFENKKDLYYWHNIIRYMKPNKPVGLAMMDYYRSLEKKNSIPLTLLMGWMEYDSFPAYLQLPLRKQLDNSRSGRVYHNEINKEKLLLVIEKYLNHLPVSTGRAEGRWYNHVYDSLEKADPQLKQTFRISDEAFGRLNAAALLAYCYRQAEQYRQVCGFAAGFNPYEKIDLLPDPIFGTARDYSERQRKALMEKRDSVVWLLLNDFRDQRLYNVQPKAGLMLLLHTWQIIPDFLKMDRLKLFKRTYYLPLLCQFMLINRYSPFIQFWEKESMGRGFIPRIKGNEEKIMELAATYYEWKMMTDGEE